MAKQSTLAVNDPGDSADDVFTAPDPNASYGPDKVEQGAPPENVLAGGTSYLPSHPEPQLPPEASQSPPFPISVNDENYRRGNWGSKFEFLAVLLCQLTPIQIYFFFYYHLYRGGGLIFIVPYMTMVFCCGFPVILLAISLGQFCSTGFLTSWKFMPVFKGVSVIVFLQTCGTLVWLNVLLQMAYSFMFDTIINFPTPPWTTCSNSWNNATTCRDRSYVPPDAVPDGSVASVSEAEPDYGMSNMLSSFHDAGSEGGDYDYNYVRITMPSEEYFKYMYTEGNITAVAIVGAIIALLVVSAATMLGVKVVGKFCMCILGASFVLSVVLLIRSCTLPGASLGFQYLFVPQMGRLFTREVWKSAFFYVNTTLVSIFWPCVALGSHNRFHNGCFLDTALLVMAFIFSPVMMAIIIFAIFGFFAQSAGVPVEEVVTIGPDMVFGVFPYMLSYLPKATLWTLIWFGLVALNLLGTQIGTILAMTSSILDLFGCVHGWQRVIPVSLGLCVITFICTFISLAVGVESALHFFDFFFMATAFGTVMVLSVCLVWFYGTHQEINVLRYAKDLQAMIGFFPDFFKVIFSFVWAIAIPVIYTFATIDQLIYSTEGPTVYMYCAGIVVGIIGIIVGALHEARKHGHIDTYFTDFFYRASLPLPQWGPELDVHRQQAGYLPRDFTPQPYRLSHRSDMGAEGSVVPLQPLPASDKREGAMKTDPDPEGMPATTPLIYPALSPNETQL